MSSSPTTPPPPPPPPPPPSIVCDCLAEEAWDADFITCDYCGNRWDGYAQCTCWGYLNSSAQVNDEDDDIARNAKGTIIEIDYGTTTDEDEDEEDDTTRNAKGTIIEIDYGTTTDEED